MTAEPRRYFIGVAVTDPAPGTALERLPQTPEDLRMLADAFALLGYEVVDTSAWTTGKQLSANECSSGLTGWLDAIEPGEHVSVVFYFFGHALRSEGFDRHYLCFRGCHPEAPSNGGMLATELAALMLGRTARPGKAWFILDCCYSGHGGAELALAFAGYRPVTAFRDAMSYWVTTSSGSVAQYADGAFSRALGSALSTATNMTELQDALTEALGPRARQKPDTRPLFGSRDFLAANGSTRPRSTALPSTRVRPRRRERSRVLVFVLAATLVGGVVVLARARLKAVEAGAVEAPAPAIPGMVWLPRATILLGEEQAEARRVFDACRESHKDKCGKDFEGSVFARAVRAPGAAPVAVEGFYLDETEVPLRAFVGWLNAESAKLSVQRGGSKTSIIDAAGHRLAAIRTPGTGDEDTETEGRPDIGLGDGQRRFLLDEDRADLPMTLVTWHGARSYCEANGKRLPTEREWERAARGVTGRRFPWGEAPATRCHEVVFARKTGELCANGGGGAAAVGTSRGDVTPDGLRDLGGNVTEWTSSLFETNPAGSSCKDDGGACRVLRGGNYADSAPLLRSSTRWRFGENRMRMSIGFRCARDGGVES